MSSPSLGKATSISIPLLKMCAYLSGILVVQSLSGVQLFVIPWTAACPACLSSTISRSLLKFMPSELVKLTKHLILCSPLLLLPSVSPIIRVFSNELALCIRWPKYWSFSISIHPFNEYSDWFPLRLTSLISLLQGTLKSLLQHRSLRASILWCSTFFIVQLSTYWKNHSFDYTDLCWQGDVSAF